jgi:hypothetical protein
MIGEVMKGKSARVIDAFAVERKGEEERYRPYANLPNRTLLYPLFLSLFADTIRGSRAGDCNHTRVRPHRGHGTGVANVMGILRKGLCLNPIGAKSSGATFGPGSTSFILFHSSPDIVSYAGARGVWCMCVRGVCGVMNIPVYFSDLPNKSLNYMKPDSEVGCFLLCEVALGEGLIRRTTRGRTTLPPVR